MDSAEIRSAFEILDFDEPTKDKGSVKVKYRALALEFSSDRTKDPHEKKRLEELARKIHEAKAVCLAFCESPLSIEEIEQEGELDQKEAHQKYLQMVQLFIGRIIQRRYKFWTRVSLPHGKATPEFNELHPKNPLVNTSQGVFNLLAKENGREEVQWVNSFEGGEEYPLSWVVVELVDASYEALVFFHRPPLASHILTEVTDTLITLDAQARILAKQGLKCLRKAQGIQNWGLSRQDPMIIRITGSGSSLCWRIPLLDGEIFWFVCQRQNTMEGLNEVLPLWIQRLKDGE